MKNLIIIGAGSFGRELYNWIINSDEIDKKYVIKGFIDNKMDILGDKKNYPPILSSVDEYDVCKDDIFICAMTEPKIRKYCVDIIRKKNGEFINYIDKSCLIGTNIKIGIGNVFCPYTILTSDISVGDYNIFNCGSVIGHDVVIKDYCSIMVNVSISGNCKLGNDIVIGTNSVLIPNVSIGDNCFIGASTTVLRDLKENCRVFGNPAKIIGYNEEG